MLFAETQLPVINVFFRDLSRGFEGVFVLTEGFILFKCELC